MIPGYHEFRLIGAGGFSKVYTAFQEEFARTVAVKIITVAVDDAAVRRFARERAITGQLDGHPHIVRVYDSGVTANGEPYLAMEHHQQGSLADRLRRRGPLPWTDVLEAGVHLAEALEFAHQRGIVHRDVKPQNVLVSSFLGPVLADFGIAAIPETRLTTVGHEAFSVLHAAPEVLAGAPATPASDLYSLASTLYELLAGRAPFADPDHPGLLALLHRVQHDPLPPIEGDDVPAGLKAELTAMLARDPDSRPGSGAAMADRLRALQRALHVTVTPVLRGDPTSGTGPVAGPADPVPGDWAVWAPPPVAPDTRDRPVDPFASTPPDGDTPELGSSPAAPVARATPETVHLSRPGSGAAGDRLRSPSPPQAIPSMPATPPAPGPWPPAGLAPNSPVETVSLGRPVSPGAPVAAEREPHPPRRRRRMVAAAAVIATGAALSAMAYGLHGRDAITAGTAPGGSTLRPAPTAAPTPNAALGPCPVRQGGDLPARPLRKGAPPANVSVEPAPGGQSATVRWVDSNAGTTAYVVFARCAAAGDRPVAPVRFVGPGEGDSAVIDGLRADANYCFSVGVIEPTGGTTLFTDSDDRTQFRCLDGTRR